MFLRCFENVAPDEFGKVQLSRIHWC